MTNPHSNVLLRFSEASLRSVLDTLGDNEYPIAKTLTDGEVEELGQWVTALFLSKVKDLIDLETRMFLEEIEGRQERGTR